MNNDHIKAIKERIETLEDELDDTSVFYGDTARIKELKALKALLVDRILK